MARSDYGQLASFCLAYAVCVFFAGWLVSGNPAGSGALDVSGIGADGVVPRLHARLFGLLVELTGGVSGYV